MEGTEGLIRAPKGFYKAIRGWAGAAQLTPRPARHAEHPSRLADPRPLPLPDLLFFSTSPTLPGGAGQVG